jgi:hypothetical protein
MSLSASPVAGMSVGVGGPWQAAQGIEFPQVTAWEWPFASTQKFKQAVELLKFLGADLAAQLALDGPGGLPHGTQVVDGPGRERRQALP